MKVLVLGAGGIVGQSMMLYKPDKIQVKYLRSRDVDLRDHMLLKLTLDAYKPDVVVNLAGQNSVDAVEEDPDRYWTVNTLLAIRIADWCDVNNAHLIQVSTQGVFDGEEAPYKVGDRPCAVNQYGVQKAEAEDMVRIRKHWTIARLTFVAGVRPFQGWGRRNPVEDMLSGAHTKQVEDRYFSPCFPRDAAMHLWNLAITRPIRKTFHIGTPVRTSRYQLAQALLPHSDIEPVSHDDFPGLARRPYDTTWADSDWNLSDISFSEGIEMILEDWKNTDRTDLWSRAQEVALFLGESTVDASDRLRQGFVHNHHAVAADFRAVGPIGDDALLDWYRKTEAYIWELSAYHLDEGFNYSGMCRGIVDHCLAHDIRKVACLGDGIGDLTLGLARAGLNATYHDLMFSKTADFAQFRFDLNLAVQPNIHLTEGWEPTLPADSYNAVVALDFFEHLVNVEEWAKSVSEALKPGGWLLAQNAFAIGDDEHGGSIPMHLVKNNRFERDWDPLLSSLGLEQGQGGWWRKPGE